MFSSNIWVHIKAGYDVVLIDNWEEHVNCINDKGMEVQTDIKNYLINIPAVESIDVSEKFDLIIILTKAMEAVILSMMNDLGNGEGLSKFVPISEVYLAVTMWTARLRGPGKLLLLHKRKKYI